MGGNVESIKERLDIAEVISPYLKLEKTGANFRARCPFHNEKTPSFFVSMARQSYYCFGCGAKGDMFTFVEEMESVDFKEALKMLAEKAGVELKEHAGADTKEKAEREKLLGVLEEACGFFVNQLVSSTDASKYLASRGITPESVKEWRIGWAPDEWRTLYSHLSSLGFEKGHILKAGLAKYPEGKEDKDPYDVFRGRVIFPLFDSSGKVVGFSGRSLAKDADTAKAGPKYLNSPDTVLFTKSELLYGLHKAKDDIRRKNYAVLVEGQMDLVLSHQAGVKNTVASSGTAFTATHLERLKKISPRIVLAFDGDNAGKAAAEKSSILAMSLGMEVKVADLKPGTDPADVIKGDPDAWKDVLRQSVPAIEYFLSDTFELEKDQRKRNKLVEKRILPLILLLESAMERSHFVSLIAKRSGIKEEVVWEDLRRAKAPVAQTSQRSESGAQEVVVVEPTRLSRKEVLEARLAELAEWRKDLKGQDDELEIIEREEKELARHLAQENMSQKLALLTAQLAQAEAVKDQGEVSRLTEDIAKLHKDIQALEVNAKVM